jgi:chromate transporter
MLAVLTWQFFQNGQKGLGWKGNLAVVSFSFIIMEVVGIHPGILIALLLGLALFGPENKKGKQAENQAVVPERKTV